MVSNAEYQVIQSRATGEQWVLNPASMTCGQVTSPAEREEALTADLSRWATDDEADDWMLDARKVDILRVYNTDAALTESAVAALTDGSNRAFARAVGLDLRGVQRRLNGDTQLSELERRYYRLIIAHPASFRRWLTD